jgi:hypothetical protein
VHDRDKKHLTLGILEDDGIRKTMGEATAGTGGKLGPGCGEMKDAGNGSSYLGGKLKSKSRALIVVVENRCAQFFLCRRKELNRSIAIH